MRSWANAISGIPSYNNNRLIPVRIIPNGQTNDLKRCATASGDDPEPEMCRYHY